MSTNNNYRLSFWGAAGHTLIYVVILLYFGSILFDLKEYLSEATVGFLYPLIYVAVFCLYFIILKKVYKFKLIMPEKLSARNIFYGFLAGITCYIINVLIVMCIKHIAPEAYRTTIEAFEAFASFHAYTTFLLYEIVFGPIAEELLFRKFILTGLKNKYSTLIALFLSAFLFAIAHLPLTVQATYALVTGLLLGVMYIKTGSIFACITAHICNNGLAVLLSDFFF